MANNVDRRTRKTNRLLNESIDYCRRARQWCGLVWTKTVSQRRRINVEVWHTKNDDRRRVARSEASAMRVWVRRQRVGGRAEDGLTTTRAPPPPTASSFGYGGGRGGRENGNGDVAMLRPTVGRRRSGDAVCSTGDPATLGLPRSFSASLRATPRGCDFSPEISNLPIAAQCHRRRSVWSHWTPPLVVTVVRLW